MKYKPYLSFCTKLPHHISVIQSSVEGNTDVSNLRINLRKNKMVKQVYLL